MQFISPVLPNELLDLIVDHAHSDRQSLLSLSLTSKVFVPSARHHLFSTLCLTSADSAHRACTKAVSQGIFSSTESLRDVLGCTTSTIREAVREVILVDGGWGEAWIDDLFSGLVHDSDGQPTSTPTAAVISSVSFSSSSPVSPNVSCTGTITTNDKDDNDKTSSCFSHVAALHFPNVHTLTISSLHETLSSPAILALSQIFSHVKTLKLEELELEDGTDADVLELVCAFKELESLSLEGGWSSGQMSMDPKTSLRLPPRLGSLDFLCTTHSILPNLLSLSDTSLTVHTLRIRHLSQSDLPSLQACLQILGATLNNLTLGYLSLPSGISGTPTSEQGLLASNVALETLAVVFPHYYQLSHPEPTFVIDLLNHLAIHSNSLSQLSFAWRDQPSSTALKTFVAGLGRAMSTSSVSCATSSSVFMNEDEEDTQRNGATPLVPKATSPSSSGQPSPKTISLWLGPGSASPGSTKSSLKDDELALREAFSSACRAQSCIPAPQDVELALNREAFRW